MKNQNTIPESPTIIFEPTAPHPEPVTTGDLLTEIEAVITRHVVLGDAAATARAVWVLHTYVYGMRNAVACLACKSPKRQYGETG